MTISPQRLDRDLFEQVQALLESRRGTRRERQAARAPLAGLVFDALGNRMAVSHARGRGSRRYNYYLSSVPASHPDAPRVLRRAPAGNLEDLVIERLRSWSRRPAAAWPDVLPFVRRIAVHRDAIVINVMPPAHERWEIAGPDIIEATDDRGLRITSPVRVSTCGGRTSRIDGSARPPRCNPDRALIAGLRRAHTELQGCGIDLADSGCQLENARGIDDPYLRKLTRLAFLAPDIQRAILEGRQPAGLKLADLMAGDLPLDRNAQREALGFA